MKKGAIILSGGMGARLGCREKGLIIFEGETLVARKIHQLAGRFDEIIVVTNAPELYKGLPAGTIITSDDVPHHGPLHGLYCGLCKASYELNFVTAVDMPFLNADLMDCIERECARSDIVVFEVRGKIEPLFGFYSRRILPVVKPLLVRKDMGPAALVSLCHTKIISESEVREHDPGFLSFANINTEEDLRRHSGEL